MGILVAKKYQTWLFMKLADHTYVECGAGGKAWSCWGGKTGGTAFKQGVGSTNRADMIAQPNERAGIRRYLIDGVCHQAANRILLPAGITTQGATGYDLSIAIFGIYGRSHFERFPNKTGDIPECEYQQTLEEMQEPVAGDDKERTLVAISAEDSRRFDATRGNPLDGLNFNVQRFMNLVDFKLSGMLDPQTILRLNNIKASQELRLHSLAEALDDGILPPEAFVIEFNNMTDQFQNQMAEALEPRAYEQLLGERPGEKLILADPEGIDSEFGEGTAARVYGNLR